LRKKHVDNCANNLKPENAKMELQSNDNFLIFYAVLLFTFVTALLAITSILNMNKQTICEQHVLGSIYEGMCFGIVVCIIQFWTILRENDEIVNNTNLFPDLKQYYEGRGFMGKSPWILKKWFELIVILIVLFPFELLLFLEIGKSL
jgi:hypothetical protein